MSVRGATAISSINRLVAALALVVSMSFMCGCLVHMTRYGPRLGQESEWLSDKIGSAATKLRRSRETELIFSYRPEFGVDQRYSIRIDNFKWPCPLPCHDPSRLVVYVDKGYGGTTTHHRLFVGVPKSLEIHKDGQPTEIVLRKNKEVIELVELR